MSKSGAKETSVEKKVWVTPTLGYDGELTEILEGSMKPTEVTGEPGDPGAKPQNE
jgi:hypothetical protein